MCSSRHRKTCRYFKEFMRCKFGEYCRYSHKKREDASGSVIKQLDEKVETLGNKIDQNRNILEKVNENEISQNERINELTKELKIKCIEMDNLRSIIEHLANKVKKIENTISKPELTTPSNISASLNNITSSSSTTVAVSVSSPQSDQSEECCDHRCCPGRRDHNRPPDKSQCCYHRCRKYRHYIWRKPS